MFYYSYDRLWEILDEKEISKTDLQIKLGISSAAMDKMKHNEKVSNEVILKLSKFLGVPEYSIFEYKSDIQIWMESLYPVVRGIEYSIRLYGWPVFRFELTLEQQRKFNDLLQLDKIENILKICEETTNQECPVNVGIINSSKVELNGNVLQFEGSYGVVQKFIQALFFDVK